MSLRKSQVRGELDSEHHSIFSQEASQTTFTESPAMNPVTPEHVTAASGPSPKVVLAGGVGSGALMLLLSAGIVIWTLSRPQPAPLLASNLEVEPVEQE